MLKYCALIFFSNCFFYSFCLIKIKFDRFSSQHLIAYFGSFKEKYSMTLDLMNHTTWLVPNMLNETILITSSNIINDDIKIQMGFNHFKGKEIITSFAFEDDSINTIDSYQIYYFTSIPRVYLSTSGHLGLVSAFQDENYSIIHQYYNQGLINHRSFSLVFSLTNSYLYLGGIPENDTNNKYHSFCNINKQSIYWDCLIQSIYYEIDKEIVYLNIPNGSIARMNTLDNLIFAPQSFMNELYMKYFDDITKNKLCDFTDFKNTKQLYCYTERNKNDGKLSFIIDDYIYTFPMSFFWLCDIDLCYFEIVQNPYGDYWLIGARFYHDKNLYFDYESKTVHFYSQSGVELLINNIPFINILFWFLFIVMIFGIGLLMIIRKNYF